MNASSTACVTCATMQPRRAPDVARPSRAGSRQAQLLRRWTRAWRGLAIALPRPNLGWIFIDGCKADTGQYPLHEIWEKYRLDGEATEGIVLTHPHKDHYAGMVELIDLTAPRWLACVATHHRAEVQALRDDPVVEDYPGLLAGPVKDVLSRIQRAWDWNLAERVELRAGRRLPLARTDLTIDVVAPDPAGTRQFFAPAGLAERLRRCANELMCSSKGSTRST